MDSVDSLYVKISAETKGLVEAARIQEDVSKLKGAIYDTISHNYNVPELLEKYPFPTLLDKNNGILYAREITNSRFFMIVLKSGELDAAIMEFKINAKQFDDSS